MPSEVNLVLFKSLCCDITKENSTVKFHKLCHLVLNLPIIVFLSYDYHVISSVTGKMNHQMRAMKKWK